MTSMHLMARPAVLPDSRADWGQTRRPATTVRYLRFWFLVLAASITATRIGPALAQTTPTNFTIAFIGDQGLGDDARAVLQLIKDEGAEVVVHAGDFDYSDDPQAWDDQINAVLGEDFPYFAAAGNHDEERFYGGGGYQHFMDARMDRLGIPWRGDLGVQSSHTYAGILFVLTAPDVFGPGDGLYDQYIRDELSADTSLWRISVWHKNMSAMQVGGKGDETGWGVYEESRKGGAIIATGHEHSYSRTHLLSDLDDQVVASTSDTLVLARDDPRTANDEGRSFAFVSGLGGESRRGQSQEGPWWAAAYTADQDANYGALFGVFNYQGNPRRAYFYFKDIAGFLADEFFVETCASGDCQPGPVVNCNDSIACTRDTYDAGSDSCRHSPDNAACSNGRFCDGAEVCDPTRGCLDGPDPCTDEVCDEPTDRCVECGSDADCNDGLYCNGVETCVNRSCEAGPAVDCRDGISCTAGACNENARACDHTPNDSRCDNGSFCDGAEVCDPTRGCLDGPDPCGDAACDEPTDRCVECGSDADCNDGLYCNGVETCVNRSCEAGATVDCRDGISCTADACNENARACDHTPNDSRCDDGQFCDGDEVCDPMLGCQGGPGPCVGQQCDEARRTCTGCVTDTGCDDGNPCTTDTCVTGGGCRNVDTCGSTPIVFEEANTGTSTGSSTVVTTANVIGVPGDLYLAAISYKPNTTVTAMTGLGLTWTRLRAQCAGRGQTGIELWVAQGIPSGHDVVTAALAAVVEGAVIAVSRYSGVNASDPIGSFGSANSNGVGGACWGGIDGPSYSYDLPSASAGSVVYGASATRHRTHAPGSGYHERTELVSGVDGSAAGLAASDRIAGSTAGVTVDGTLSGDEDWAVLAAEIRPATTTADCQVDFDCDDGILDNGAETCVAGACRAGPPVGSGGNVATGASDLSSTVVTAANVLGVPGDLYLAAISYKPNTVVTAVSGLGLTWTRLGGQCAGRGQTGVEVWSAQGMPSGDGVVTAALAVAVESAVIAVSRYTGISTDDPIGSVESANSNGADGPCTEGSDSVSYIYELPQVGAGSIVYSTAAMRHRAHMPGVAYQYRGGIINGYDGTAASVAASDRAVASASTVIVDGSFSSPVDWAAMAVELKPSVTAACSGGAPCDDGL